ncbi:MAG: methionyl-tRNA formyltransferase [Patescibacteria group bacterium]
MITQPHILFFGTPEFASPSLSALVENGYKIVGIVTMPDEPAGRNQTLTPPPIKILAESLGLPIFQPKKLEKEMWLNSMPEADIFVLVAYGKILPSWLLELPRFGTINIHPSLLPKFRGPSPIQNALLAGEKTTGVSIMLMDKDIDHGPILALQQIPIDNTDTIISLSEKLAYIGAKILCQTIPEWTSHSLKPIAQDHSKATFTKIIKKEDGHINWSREAKQIINQLRAFAIWPKCWTILENNSQKTRIIILNAHTTTRQSHTVTPGTSIINTNEFLIATNDYFIAIDKLQPENKKEMSASAFLQGYKLDSLTRFT